MTDRTDAYAAALFEVARAEGSLPQVENELFSLARDEITVGPLPRFPAVSRDLALIVSDRLPHEELQAGIRAAGGPLLEQVTLFDVYHGAPVPEGHRSLAYSLTFRSPERTLTEDEIGATILGIERIVTTQFGAQIRGR